MCTSRFFPDFDVFFFSRAAEESEERFSRLLWIETGPSAYEETGLHPAPDEEDEGSEENKATLVHSQQRRTTHDQESQTRLNRLVLIAAKLTTHRYFAIDIVNTLLIFSKQHDLNQFCKKGSFRGKGEIFIKVPHEYVPPPVNSTKNEVI